MTMQTISQQNKIIIGLFRAYHDISLIGDQLAAEHGLTTSKWKVLGAIRLENTALTVPHIARLMGLTRQAVQRTIDELLKLEYIQQLHNPAHKKSSLFQLTNLGEEAFDAINIEWDKMATTIFQDLNPHDIDSTVNVLTQMITKSEAMK
ncbi:DNA-binding transcriptional regulator [Commensalibacter communis]|uniref:MarR family (MarR) n=1 Tax=Commensalibacter communis TaxID=2972786 RepID=A0A9W4TPY7_9PROT|nr:MarR family transcriptional regulator [Commensalibacter communis]CAI3950337.1 DNA-binding transcriptional regulator [Commensalibacter communis]CAI3952732.1 DNA-binding transcriptional regulator [Commensalibacter communis]CAI3954422.1 DNA-binding transcriptional regulator [Commensalibacter communis]CAI3955344.1 DNA-binding transcriptional regulator [Commensalibacter communis]